MISESYLPRDAVRIPFLEVGRREAIVSHERRVLFTMLEENESVAKRFRTVDEPRRG